MRAYVAPKIGHHLLSGEKVHTACDISGLPNSGQRGDNRLHNYGLQSLGGVANGVAGDPAEFGTVHQLRLPNN